MSHSARSVAKSGLAACLACALAFGAAPAAVAAGVDPDGLARFKAAFAVFDALAGETRKLGAPPRLRDPDSAAVLAGIWDVGNVIGAAPWTARDVPTLLDMLQMEQAAVKTYALFSADAAIPANAAANETALHPEMTRSFAAMLALEGPAIDAIADFAAKLPSAQMSDVRRAGLAKMRSGYVEQLSGMLLVMTDGVPGDEAGNALLAHGVAAVSPRLAGALTLHDRAPMAQKLRDAAAKLVGAPRADIEAAAKAFDGSACDGLCAVK